MVGAIGAVVDFSTFNLVTQVFGVDPTVANVISFTVAVISNFIWNRFWTYPDSRTKTLTRQLGEFFIVNVIGVLIRTPIFVWMAGPWQRIYEWQPIRVPIGAETIGNNLALATAMVVVMFWNFFVNRYWTYADVK